MSERDYCNNDETAEFLNREDSEAPAPSQTETPPPEAHRKTCGYHKGWPCDCLKALFYKPQAISSVPRTAQSDIGLRKRIHFLEKHNQHFERCESAWCHPTPDNDPGSEFALGQDGSDRLQAAQTVASPTPEPMCAVCGARAVGESSHPNGRRWKSCPDHGYTLPTDDDQRIANLVETHTSLIPQGQMSRPFKVVLPKDCINAIREALAAQSETVASPTAEVDVEDLCEKIRKELRIPCRCEPGEAEDEIIFCHECLFLRSNIEAAIREATATLEARVRVTEACAATDANHLKEARLTARLLADKINNDSAEERAEKAEARATILESLDTARKFYEVQMAEWKLVCASEIFQDLKHGEFAHVLHLLQDGEISVGKAAEAIAEIAHCGTARLPDRTPYLGDDETWKDRADVLAVSLRDVGAEVGKVMAELKIRAHSHVKYEQTSANRPNGYAAVLVPDWLVKQWVEKIHSLLSRLNLDTKEAENEA